MDDDMKAMCKLRNFLISVSVLGSIVLAGLIFLGVTNNIPVEVAVAEASLGRLALVAPGGNCIITAYNLSLAVAVSNTNTATFVWRAAPLDAELRLGGRPFAQVRLAGAGAECIRPSRTKVYRAAVAVAKSAAVGVFRLELIVYGKFMYSTRIGRRFNTTVSCPLRLPLSTARPQPCTDLSNSEMELCCSQPGVN